MSTLENKIKKDGVCIDFQKNKCTSISKKIKKIEYASFSKKIKKGTTPPGWSHPGDNGKKETSFLLLCRQSETNKPLNKTLSVLVDA